MAHPGRVLIAADKFKGSLTAVEVAQHVSVGLRRVHPDLRVEALPVADGGDGTVAAAVAGGFERREARVTGPLGAPVTAAYALRGKAAVVEMAEASGLQLLPPGEFAPLTATTYGTGELLLAAIDAGARSIVLGVGGSATTDGGAGMLGALGARFTDAAGAPRRPRRRPAARSRGRRPDRPRPAARGRRDRARRRRRQPADRSQGRRGRLRATEGRGSGRTSPHWTPVSAGWHTCSHRRRWGRARCEAARYPGAGAAGGIGYGALVGLGAAFRPGIEVLLEVLGFAPALEQADLVITGEGSLDAQTLHGKAPAGVAAAARRAGKPVVAVCGRLAIDEAAVRAAGIEAVYALASLEPDPARCMTEAGPLLERAAVQLATDLL